jgi:4-nitrophenyl phosphatase
VNFYETKFLYSYIFCYCRKFNKNHLRINKVIEKLKSIKCYMLDMDGTFYLGDHLLPGSLDFMDYLARNKLDYLFLTNNSSKDRIKYSEKICKLGFNVDEAKIFTSGEATTIYLRKNTKFQKVFILGTESLENEFMLAGFELVKEKPDAVVLGFDTTLTYEKIWKACDLIREKVPYIATHPDLNCPTEVGFMPDIGSFIAMIDASTGRKPDVIIGKPNNHIVNAVVEKTGYQLNEIAMIGDRLYTDIALGKAGISTILVLSGETKSEDLKTSEFIPDIVGNDLGDLIVQLEK